MNQLASNAPQTLAWEPVDSLHILACPRVHLPTVQHLLPEKYITTMQEKPPSACCRDLNNLDIEAWYSSAVEQGKGVPDLYKFHCNSCSACHVRFCVGGNHPTDPTEQDIRPFWDVR